MNYLLGIFVVGVHLCSGTLIWKSRPITISTVTNGNNIPNINTGGMDVLGYVTLLAQGGRRKKTGESFVRIFNEEYKFGTGKSWSGGALLYPSRNDTESFGYSVSLGGSLKTLNMLFAGTPSNNTVYVFKDTRVNWSQQQILEVDESQRFDMFGFSVAVDKFDPHRLIVGAPGDDDLGLSSGSAYIFSASPTASFWSVGQKLLSSDFHSQDQFGYDVTMGDGMAAVTSPGNCKVYLYSEDIPGTSRAAMTEWHLLPDDVDVSEAPAKTRRDFSSSSFDLNDSPPKMLKWTEQQVLYFPNCSRQLSVAQYKDKLVVGVANANDAVFSNHGRAHYFEAKTYIGQCGGDFMPKSFASFGDIMALRDEVPTSSQRYLRSSADIKLCTTTKWSQMQTFVHPLGASACQYFGTDVDIYKDTLIISAKQNSGATTCVSPYTSNPGLVTVYQHLEKQWTATSSLSTSSNFNVDGFGANDIAVFGLDVAVSTKEGFNRVYTYSGNSSDLRCVVVFLGDQFGDGWSGAELVITDSSGLKERYAPKCNSVLINGFRQLRWCPDSETAFGDVTFEIVNAKHFPFFWEIAWHIYQENSGMSVYGDHKTKIIVNYDSSREMTVVSTENRLEAETVNNGCSSYTTCQMTPTPTRYPTRAPTPAPTKAGASQPASSAVSSDAMAKTAVLALTMYDTGANSWFADYNMETSYSITSRNGSKVHARGTMCQSQAQVTCYLELPLNEKMSFRLSGALDSNSNQHSWRFCDQSGTAGTQQQLDFHLSSDGSCVVDKLYSTALYCLDKVHIVVAAMGMILLHGLSSMTELTSADEAAVTYALSKLVGSEDDLYVTYTYEHDDTFDALKVVFNIEIPTWTVGYDGSDSDNLQPALQVAMGLITDGISSGDFNTFLELYASSHSSASDLFNHGFVELESIEEGILRDHGPLTYAPSPFWEDVPTMAPSHIYNTPKPSPSTSTTNGKSGEQSSGHNHGSDDSSDWSTELFIASGVVVAGLMFMLLVRYRDQSSSSLFDSSASIARVESRKKSSRTYKELSTESRHESGEGSDEEVWEEEEEEEGVSGQASLKKILLAAAAESQKESKSRRFSAISSVESGEEDVADSDSASKSYRHSSGSIPKKSSKSRSGSTKK